MAGSVIGALRVVLGADSAALDKGLKDAQGSLQNFANKVGEAGRLAAAGFVIATAALAVAIKGTINEADKLYKMSQSFGVPIEELSKLKYAADLSGVSLEALGKSVGKLSRNMMEAAANPTGEAAKAFDALKIKVQNADGTLKSSSLVIEEIAGKFAGFKDGAAKTALAIAIFGRAGADMIPLLNQGKQGLQEMTAEAEALGLVIDQRTGAAAEAFNDNLTRMRKVFDGIVIKVTAEMLPAFLQFSKILVENAKNQSFLKSVAENLVAAIRFAITAVLTGTFVFQRFGAEIVALANVVANAAPVLANFLLGITTFQAGPLIKAAQGIEGVRQAWANFGKEVAETEKGRAELAARIAEFYKTAGKGADELAKKPEPKNEAPIIQGNKNAIDNYISSLVKKGAAMQADLQTVGMSESAHYRLKAMLEIEAIAKENNLKITEKQRQKLLETVNANAALIDSLEESKDRWDNFRSAVLQVRSSLENAFVDAIMQAKSFKEIIRSLISDLARMAAQQAFRSMFGGQLAWSNAAGSAFNGGGAGILGGIGKLFGFAQGGSFQVGGSGGIDSQLVAFKASPNERVSVTKPGQDMGGGVTIYQTIAPVFHPGMTPTDMASIRSMMTTVSEQTKADTINTIRGAMSRDSRAFAL